MPPLDNRFRVLLVEDNEGDAVLVQEYIDEAGQGRFVLKRARTLAEGQRLLAEFNPQVVLLDLNLPDSKGEDTLTNFGSVGARQLPKPPIIVLTSLDDRDMADRALSGAAQDYLVKGEVTPSRLLRAIRVAIQQHGRGEIDKILREPDRADGGDREALEILQRVNRTAPGEVAGDFSSPAHSDPRRTSSLLFEHYTLGSKAAEAIAAAHNQRLQKLEELSQNFSLDVARRELIWLQLEKLLLGNGKGPLAVRLDSMENALIDRRSTERDRHKNRAPWQVKVAVLLLGWIGLALTWLVVHLMQAGPGP
jgi:DNA-binding response OmpR family regulator